MVSGHFICLEGIEGTGKTTHAQFISDYLKQRYQTVLMTREPGGTEIAESIRALLLHSNEKQESMTAEAELLLMFAARAQHLRYVIEPALLQGQWVVCDRFVESSYAYQGGGRGMDEAFIDYLNQKVQKSLKIDCVLLFDVPVKQALSQMRQRRDQSLASYDRIEAETYEFFDRARNVYLERAERYPHLYHVIDASQPLTQVQQQIVSVLKNQLLVPDQQ